MNEDQNISGIYVFSNLFGSDIMSKIAQFVYTNKNRVLLSIKYGGNMTTEDYHLLRYRRLIHFTFKKCLWSKRLACVHDNIEIGKKQIMTLKKECKQKCDEMKYVNRIYRTTSLSDENYNSRQKELSKCLNHLSWKIKEKKKTLTKNVRMAESRHKSIRKILRKHSTSYRKSNYSKRDMRIMFDCPKFNIRRADLKRCYQNIMIDSFRKRYESTLS